MYLNKKFYLYIIFSLTIFLGFVLNENSSGGAKFDNEYLFPFIENFKGNISNALDLFAKDTGTLIHSPVFYFLIGKILSLLDNLYLINIGYILISCSLPYFFYLILIEKFDKNFDYLFYFSLLIFISPYFRSSAIWLLGDNLSLIFFSLSIYFINKRKKVEKNFYNFLLCLVFLCLCCYIRYYYAVFSIYYFFIFYKNVDIKKFCFLILIALILSFPAFTYLLHMFNNYDFLSKLTKYGNLNLYSNSLLIFSIILFYLFPFLILYRDQLKSYIKKNLKFIVFAFLFFFFIFLFDYYLNNKIIYFSELGGGIFLKLATFLSINTSLCISLISFVSLVSLDFFFKGNRLENYLLLIILILSFPVLTIYQKYFDPFFLLFFFGLIKSNQINEFFVNSIQDLKVIYIYFLSFYFFSLIYYL